MTSEQVMERLLAESEIRDVIARYARGVDRNDMALLRSVYHPDAIDNHGFFTGGVEEFIEWFTNGHKDVLQSMHFMGTCLIEFTSETQANVETYCQVFQRARDASLAAGSVRGSRALCRYIDRFERRDGQWLIASRSLLFENLERSTEPEDLGFPAHVLLQRHGPDDPSYALKADATR